MTNKILFLVAILLLLPSFAMAEDDSDKPELVVAFSSDLRGYLADCGCPGNIQGGLGRRAAFLNDYRQKLGLIPLLHLDAGGFANREGLGRMHTIHALLDAYDYMKVDAINVSELEIYFFQEELLDVAAYSKIPFVSANIVYEANDERLFPDRLIIERGGLKIGITGYADPGKFGDSFPNALKLDILDPIAVMPAIIKELRQECDLVILMAHEQHRSLPQVLERLPWVDLVVAGDGYTTSWQPEQMVETPVSYAGNKGRKLMLIRGFELKDDSKRFEQEMVPMKTDMSRDAVVVGMIEKAEEAIKQERSQISFREQALKKYGKDSK